jgi:hypothetical protein
MEWNVFCYLALDVQMYLINFFTTMRKSVTEVIFLKQQVQGQGNYNPTQNN